MNVTSHGADFQPLGRRSILKGFLAATLTAVPVASAAGIPVFDVVEEPTETPIKVIFRRYNAALHRHHAMLQDAPAGQWTAAAKLSPERQIMEEAKREIEDVPVTSVEDIALKAVVVTGYFSGPDWKLSHEALDFLKGH